MTRMLYMEGGLERCYERTFTAKVLEAKPDHVILDQTLFYPLGGGQEWDTGVLRTADGREARVSEVTKRGPVKHVLRAGYALQAGDEVTGTIDWERRNAHMRMHTAQHLVSGLAYELFGGPRTVGNQIHATRSRIDFNPVNFSNEMLKDLEAASNDAIRAGYAVTTASMTRDEVNAELPPERTNLDLLPKSDGPARHPHRRRRRPVPVRRDARAQHQGDRRGAHPEPDVEGLGDAAHRVRARGSRPVAAPGQQPPSAVPGYASTVGL